MRNTVTTRVVGIEGGLLVVLDDVGQLVAAPISPLAIQDILNYIADARWRSYNITTEAGVVVALSPA